MGFILDLINELWDGLQSKSSNKDTSKWVYWSKPRMLTPVEKAEAAALAKAQKMSGDVVIPDGTQKIISKLFERNKKITSVTIPSSVKVIGRYAFLGCENLERVILNEGLEEIGDCVFLGCVKLKSLVCPDSVKKLYSRTFWGSDFTTPVMNASKTVLFSFPTARTDEEWTLPSSVKTIASYALNDINPIEILHLPEGLEKIEKMAFCSYKLREITIPYSVREVCQSTFWFCKSLEKVTVLNPETKIDRGAFVECVKLKELNYGNITKNDVIFHMVGLPFLTQHCNVAANLNHRTDAEFIRCTKKCAEGNAEAMYELAEFFEKWSKKQGASLFYERAANYWRYRAYQNGNEKAAKWFAEFFKNHPHEHLDSILYESSDHNPGMYTFGIPGAILKDLGYDFFDPRRSYDIMLFDDEDVVEVGSQEHFDGPDESGFGAEDYYDWWLLDKNLQQVPDTEMFNGSMRDKNNDARFRENRAKAERILKQRKAGKA